ncbi:MAG: DNA mismatch endonuclease Vsr [Desulfobacterium sp.]|nr:DNA mismatch endonuclease Vsr [Desulfobacterium sp.]
MKIQVVDLFAGPGGLGEGFASLSDEDGESVFDIVLSVESNPIAHKTLELRSFFRKFKKCEVPEEYYQYLRKKISRDELFEKYPKEAAAAQVEAWCETLGSGEELNTKMDKRVRKLTESCHDKWVLIGGPPCQAYSIVGRSRRKKIKDYIPEEDERNYLYREYLRIIAEHQPAVFIMENVKGMLSSRLNGGSMFKKILEDLKCPSGAFDKKEKDSGCKGGGGEYELYSLAIPFSDIAQNDGKYAPADFIIESEKYGVPQARHRVILLGVKKGLTQRHPEVIKEERPVWTDHVLSGLPPLRSGLSREKDSLDRWKTVILDSLDRHWLNHGLRPKGIPDLEENIMAALVDLATIDLSRGNEFVEGKLSVKDELAWWYLDDRLGGACNHATRGHMNSDLHRYMFAACFAAKFRRSPKIQEFPTRLLPKHKSAKSGDFDDRFRVQAAGSPSATITSHISKDGHYYIHYDPVQCRSLTVREAARLQTFPDNYFFEGSRTQQYLQVGNAVPPLLARKIAVIVKKTFGLIKNRSHTDKLSKEKRSWNMAQIKSRDTKPEMIVRGLLFRMGHGFRVHRQDLPGSPDIVLSRLKMVIFVHGCYWHRHEGCRYAYNPKSRVDFWQTKFRRNVERDKKVQQALKELGWQVEVIWECETKDCEQLEKKLMKIFEG